VNHESGILNLIAPNSELVTPNLLEAQTSGLPIHDSTIHDSTT